jgi:hypothetical protein
MHTAIGISPHTGWAACVVVGGTAAKPVIVANQLIDILGDDERFCFHMAAEMSLPEARAWLPKVRKKALANAKRALAPLLGADVVACAIVAKAGAALPIEKALDTHAALHSAEGHLFRDVIQEACAAAVPVMLVAPRSLDVTGIGKLAKPPWGRDQKMAAVAAWGVLSSPAEPARVKPPRPR